MRDVAFKTDGEVAIISLQRPAVLNALRTASFDQLNEAIDRFREDPQLKAAVVHGVGRSFCAGMDLKAYAAQSTSERQDTLNLIRAADPTYCDKPIVAAIHGHCVGAGVHLALACDFRVCDETASFALPEVSIGISLTRLSWQCVRTMGLPAAMELCMLAQPVDAAWALRHQLVHRVTPAGQALGQAHELAQRLAAMHPGALQVTKATLHRAADLTYREMFEYSLPLRNAVLADADRASGSPPRTRSS